MAWKARASQWTRRKKRIGDLTKARVALYTFGLLKAPLGAEELREFAAMSPAVYGEAEASKGVYRQCGDDPPRSPPFFR